MKITWFGHSAFRFEIGQSVLLLDPFISQNPVCPTKLETASRNATHVALTHGHDDHIGDTVAICTSTGATLIAVPELCGYLSAKGVEKTEDGNHGGTIATRDFDVTFVRADHSSSSSGAYLGNPCGLIIRTKDSGKVIYHMGDTDIFGDMALINEIYKPDVGIVPIGDRYTMNPRVAALACKKFFQFQTIIPCHYKTFPVLVQSADGFIKELSSEGGKVKTPKPGESLEV